MRIRRIQHSFTLKLIKDKEKDDEEGTRKYVVKKVPKKDMEEIEEKDIDVIT